MSFFLFEMMMKIMDWWHDILLLILHLQNITFIRCRLICSLYLHTICFGSMIREIGESTYVKCITAFNMKHVMRQSSDNAVSINNFYWIILCLVAIGVKTQSYDENKTNSNYDRNLTNKLKVLLWISNIIWL